MNYINGLKYLAETGASPGGYAQPARNGASASLKLGANELPVTTSANITINIQST